MKQLLPKAVSFYAATAMLASVSLMKSIYSAVATYIVSSCTMHLENSIKLLLFHSIPVNPWPGIYANPNILGMVGGIDSF